MKKTNQIKRKKFKKVKRFLPVKIMTAGALLIALGFGTAYFASPVVRNWTDSTFGITHKEVSNLETANADLQSQLTEVLAEKATLQDRLYTAEHDIGDLQNQLTGLSSTAKNLQTQLLTLLAEKLDLQNQLDAANESITSLQTQLASETSDKASIQMQLDKVLSDKVSLQTQLDTANESISSLQTQLDTANESITNLQTQITALQTERETLQGKIDTLNANVTTLENLVNFLAVPLNKTWNPVVDTNTMIADWSTLKTEFVDTYDADFDCIISENNEKLFDVNVDKNSSTIDLSNYELSENQGRGYKLKFNFYITYKETKYYNSSYYYTWFEIPRQTTQLSAPTNLSVDFATETLSFSPQSRYR